MHLILILAALIVAWTVRLRWSVPRGNWARRWERSLLLFLFPPLLLLATATAILFMGIQGQMLGIQIFGIDEGWLSYLLAITYLIIAAFWCIKLANDGLKFVRQIANLPQQKILGKTVRVLHDPSLFSALVGFWKPEFAVTSGLLQTLDPAHLQAVIAHEQAHYDYRDTFWFFWLGWLRQITAWLPHTQALWEELLTLRELRADAKAAMHVDALLLAEALLLVASYPQGYFNIACVVGVAGFPNRLGERIDALLTEAAMPAKLNQWFWSWLVLALLPLVTVPFHG
ncbi:MAG: M48 family metalloprotease [Microcoleus sp.]